MYLNNRRNLVFRCSIVINVAVMLYAALQLSGGGGPGSVAIDWVPNHIGGADRSLNSIAESPPQPRTDSLRNFTGADASLEPQRFVEAERTTPPKPPSPAPTNRAASASSTANVAEIEKRHMAEPTALDPLEPSFDLEQQDEDALSDATLLRLRALLACQERGAQQTMRQRGEFWVVMNYVLADHGTVACHESVTYTTHAGYEFLDNVLPLVERWMAPVSLAVHAPGDDFAPTVASIRYLRDCTGSDLVRNFVTFHIFFPNSHIPSEIPDPEKFLATPYNCSLPLPYLVGEAGTYKKRKKLLYPVNVARNLAREAALTHFVLASDIELYPSPSLVPRFLNMVARNKKPLDSSSRPRVFPISIFEVDAKVKVPSTKTELQKMLANKTAIPFHKYVCPNCHSIPQGLQWMKTKETSQMDVFYVGKRRNKFQHWEPIYIGTHADPFYDERLSWEGKQDKMTQGYILCVHDYDFMILNNAFICHKPGIKRYRADAQRDSIARRQSSLIKKNIFPELKRLYGTRAGCSI